MSPLAWLPFLSLCAAALGFAAATARALMLARRPAAPPPRGFRPVVIEGGKAQIPACAEEAMS